MSQSRAATRSDGGALCAFVDETGDCGRGPNSSPFFACACIVIAEEDEPKVSAVLTGLRADLNTPESLHWNRHARTYPRRQHITRTLTALTEIHVFYVVVDKATIPDELSVTFDDHKSFYNYTAGIVLERIMISARDWPGGKRRVSVHFGHVRGFDHESTRSFFATTRDERPSLPWSTLDPDAIGFDAPADVTGLQLADQYAGMLHAAIVPDDFGNHEPSHLLLVRPQLLHSSDGYTRDVGFVVIGDEEALSSRLPWWPIDGLDLLPPEEMMRRAVTTAPLPSPRQARILRTLFTRPKLQSPHAGVKPEVEE